MRAILTTGFAFFFVLAAALANQGFSMFNAETEKVTAALDCPKPRISPPSYGFGALYGCIVGRAETVKFFINEIPNTGRVKNVKLMWNDWFKDIGYGLHADQLEAQLFVDALANLYTPSHKDELSKIFFENNNVQLEYGSFIFTYSYSRGPAIDERLIVVTEK